MNFARDRRRDDVYGPVLCSASAVAAHRGDVTTVMAAAVVRLRVEERLDEIRGSNPVPSMVQSTRSTVPR